MTLPSPLLSPLLDPRWRGAWRALLAALMLMICWLAFSPNPPPAADLGWDKLNHAAAFAALAFVGRQGMQPRAARTWRLLLVLLSFGVFIELVQSRIPGRSADWHDVVADMVGAVIGMTVHLLVVRAARALAGPRG